MEYEIVIGLEVHVQLKTKTKAFCGCPTEFGAAPNSQVCPVCLGFPGALPVLNQAALESAVKTGLALNCRIPEFTKFDRKHYYYPDLPKNFQISQYDLPLAKNGCLEIELDGKTKRIGITRCHLEEDAGKLIHKEDASLVDLNRAGIPLLEIVSEPEISSPEEAYEYLTQLKAIIQYIGASDCDMEKGSLRCDANISLRPKGQKGLGVKTELKNMNSFKAVRDGLGFEARRQQEMLEAGEKITQETRLWDAAAGQTRLMRGKEEAKDYRYFPEPDLPPFTFTGARIEELRRQIPELPQDKMRRFIREYGLPAKEAKILVASRRDADYAEECLRLYPEADKKPMVNWLVGPLFSEANRKNTGIADLCVPQKELLVLLDYLRRDLISNLNAKAALAEMVESGNPAGAVIKEKNFLQVSDVAALEENIAAAIRENPKSVEDFKGGKGNALMFLVGQVMKKSSGKANPKLVQELLRKKLGA
jgi:aspartyl-tRNA(Asn)/glutamyl-tRNA(Gln) amidotransferase subunit B